MRKTQQLSIGEKALVALLATWIAGFVDTTGFLQLSHILTANMSGNTVQVALGAASLDWNKAAERFWPLVAFVAGLVVSAAIHEAGARRKILSTSAIVFGLEALLLGSFIWMSSELWHGNPTSAAGFYASTTVLGIAMGLQNATVTKVGALSVKTTHVTGTLTKFAESLSQFLFWAHDRLHAIFQHPVKAAARTALHQKTFREASLLGGLWVAFFVGGVSAGLCLGSLRTFSLLPPLAALIGLSALDVVRPIAASDEHPQPAREN
ncbi:MAG TPA: YoaK family protein [Terriglobales bacterium]|nr:YoaK family protein [Terriglobales bacterium]